MDGGLDAADNGSLITYLRSIHGTCDRYNDAVTASLIENWIDETERRASFLRETVGR